MCVLMAICLPDDVSLRERLSSVIEHQATVGANDDDEEEEVIEIGLDEPNPRKRKMSRRARRRRGL